MNSLIINWPKTLIFGSNKPKGVLEANYIDTNPEKAFFAFFRWCSPNRTFRPILEYRQYH